MARELDHLRCVSLPRHESAAFGAEFCGGEKLEGIGGSGGRTGRSSPEQFAFMSVPHVAPVRDGACLDRAKHIFAHRSRRLARLSASELNAASCQNKAAIKPSLTLSWLILPRCSQAP